MKFKVTLASASLALLMVNNSWAQELPYYTVEEISISTDGALYGPFPVAMSEDEEFIATYSMKASLSSHIDVGLPFTFNRDCQYDDVICRLEFYGSEDTDHDSYENAYKAWRNAQSDASNGGYDSYMFGSTATCVNTGSPLLDCTSEKQQPFELGNNTDVKVTDIFKDDSGSYVVGYSTGAYENGEREFARRAFIKPIEGQDYIELLPDEFANSSIDDNGGFSSAYKIAVVNERKLVIGAASRSYPRNTTEYFNDCYNSSEDKDRYTLNDLVNCPGFDTQAWFWDITDAVEGEQVIGEPLATHWLEDNESNEGRVTFSASAFDMNASGVAVGASTFEYSNNSEGGRQRAITMSLEADGSYGKPLELKAVLADIGDRKDQEKFIYNTWALTVSDDGIVTGNREYNTEKGRNKAIEFFLYDIDSGDVNFPLKDKKIATRKQSEENGGNQYIAKSGANSRVYAANNNGWIVGEVDDYDQVDPVSGGTPRSQSAFLLDSNSTDAKEQVWLMNDLICTVDADGKVIAPLVRIRSARVINESGTVLAEGFKYGSDSDYRYKTKGIQTTFKLTPNETLSPNESPNCWESELLKSTDAPYERQGGATFWMWFFALPLLLIRRFKR